VIESEQEYLFTSNLQYNHERTAFCNHLVGSEMQRKAPSKNLFGDNSRHFQGQVVEEMKERIDLYYALVIKSCKDTIPKIIGNFVVQKTHPILHLRLQQHITKDEHSILRFIAEVNLS
jgi:hypothetical protein